jgi:hypothetical protein
VPNCIAQGVPEKQEGSYEYEKRNTQNNRAEVEGWGVLGWQADE